MLLRQKGWRFVLTLTFALMLPSQHTRATEVSAFIVNGEDSVRDYPWMTRLFLYNGVGYYNGCGGTLISSQWVLTAAHCVFDGYDDDGVTALSISPSQAKVAFGGATYYDYASQLDIPTFDIESIVIHPDYVDSEDSSYSGSGETLDYDVALLKLATPYYAAGPALMTSEQFTNLEEGSELIAIGFGLTSGTEDIRPDTLQWTTLPYVPNNSCYWSPLLTDNMVCTGESNSSDTDFSAICSGDSGGPLFYQVDGQLTLVGVSSWGGIGCNQQSIFASVSSLRSWIVENIYGYQVVEEGTASDLTDSGLISVYHYGVDPDSDVNENSYLEFGSLTFADEDVNDLLSIDNSCSDNTLYASDGSCDISFSLTEAVESSRLFMASLEVKEVDPDSETSSDFIDYCMRLNTLESQQTDASCEGIEGYEEIVYESSTTSSSSSSGGSVHIWSLLLLAMMSVVRVRGREKS